MSARNEEGPSLREARLIAQLMDHIPCGESDADVEAYRNLLQAEQFAHECGQTVEEWFAHPDVANDPVWQAAARLNREL